MAVSGEAVGLVLDVSCAPGCAASVVSLDGDRLVSVVSRRSCCWGAGALVVGVVLQPASHSPAKMAEISVKDFILNNALIWVPRADAKNQYVTIVRLKIYFQCVK